MNILFVPHNDDEALFCAYTIMREKPLVIICFDSHIQEWTTWQARREESKQAMKILGAQVDFLGLSDKDDSRDDLEKAMSYYKPDRVWACTGSHKHHKWLGETAMKLFSRCIFISTYEGNDFHVRTNWQIQPTKEEIELKNLALNCYKSQLEKNKPHFDIVRGGSEYYVSKKDM